MTPLIGTLCALGMVVVVPLGLTLLDGGRDDDPDAATLAWVRMWPVAGVIGTISLLVPRGALAGGLALVYTGATVALALSAVLRLVARRSLAPVEVAVLFALASPAVAGVSLLAERLGIDLLGFNATELALTVAHFHFAGFASALLAGLVAHAIGGRLASTAALAVPVGTLVVLVGYFTGEVVELVGAVVLTAATWAVAWLLWHRARPAATSSATRTLLAVGAVAPLVSMPLALSWAAGQAWDGLPHLSLTWTAATHGVVNALGFALCGLLGWRRLAAERAPGRGPQLASSCSPPEA